MDSGQASQSTDEKFLEMAIAIKDPGQWQSLLNTVKEDETKLKLLWFAVGDVPEVKKRDALMKVLQEKNLFPGGSIADEIKAIELEAGLYPDTKDPLFIEKLLRKREFAETKQMSMADLLREGTNQCDKSRAFELSPVQRFISRFMSPVTPYNSALLYHGVGVGKTCAAISTAEAYLEKYPKKSVIIIAPPNIQPNFTKEIFSYSEDRLKIKAGEQPNEHLGCTGNTYVQLAGVEYVRDVNVIRNRVSRIVSKRYDMYGYIEFYNFIVNKIYSRVPKGLSEKDQEQMRYDLLRREFSGRMIIIDEAHNLRDVNESAEENLDTETTEMTDSEAGKKLTPVLRDLLDYSQGNKLLLLTATPMYNSVREIIFLFNLLLRNDKKQPLNEGIVGTETAFFTSDGSLTEKGKKELALAARAYMSYMKGENPLSFPVRLDPRDVPRTAFWPNRAPNGAAVDASEIERLQYHEGQPEKSTLPFVQVQFPEETMRIYREISDFGLQEGGLAVSSVDMLVQAGNFIFPTDGPILYGFSKKKVTKEGEEKTRKPRIMSHIREFGFNDNFKFAGGEEQGSKQIASKKGPPKWLLESQIGAYSPKSQFILSQVRKSKGVQFVYSRFVASGALTLALALEANGYVNASRDTGILKDGVQDDLGGQCALCESREKQHAGKDHDFKQAKYVLLTGRAEFSGNNDKAVKKASASTNAMGEEVKVVIGSQVASEGIDLAFVRNIFVFDSWFHLNKLEQILGRGIRMCSHALLDPLMRNVTIHLLVNAYPQSYNLETMDMYMYRFALNKAIQMGKITRHLKMNALDCNLNKTAILVEGLPLRDQIDARGRMREKVNVNDMPNTSMCDWGECGYKCVPEVEIDLAKLAEESNTGAEKGFDVSTYDEYSARFRETALKARLRLLFSKQPFFTIQNLRILFKDVPYLSLLTMLTDVVDNRNFRVSSGPHQGYITYKNGFYLFQPDGILDSRVPLAIRVGDYPVKLDEYGPSVLKIEKSRPNLLVPQEETMNFKDLLRLWTECLGWSNQLLNPDGNPKVPEILSTLLKARYQKNKNELRRVQEAFSMVPWLFESIKFSQTLLKHFATVVLCFIWDEILTYKEQLALFDEYFPSVRGAMDSIWSENFLSSEGEAVFRTLNPKTGQLEYYREGVLLKTAQVRFWESAEIDKLQGITASTLTTAPIYGTNNYKYGNIVFKTNKPVEGIPGNPVRKPDTGSECSIVSATTFHIESLYELGALATSAINNNLGLEEKILRGSRSFKVNVINLCALKNLSLRLLDAMNAGKKRWFYRPISTLLSGHRGILRK